MKKIFIYPPYTGTKSNPGNMYLKLLEDSFAGYDNWELIKERRFKVPFYNLLYHWYADMFIFSWIEGLVYSIPGKIKFLLIAIIIILARLTNRNVIWILHNRHPHKGKTWETDLAMLFMAKMSTRVITHSQSGVTFFDSKFKSCKGKCFYIPHPIYSKDLLPSSTYKWDYIIWGEITSRKGVLDFVKYANSSYFFRTKKILICGRCKDPVYSELLSKECGSNITYLNEFVSDSVLRDYISKSKYILFPYQTSSVLSSGALIYSLNFAKPIIGPNVGAFADLINIVTCYGSFKEIENVKIVFDKEVLLNYINQNEWKSFPSKLIGILNK